MNELNPNHPVTNAMREHWHVVVAIIMQKHDLQEVVITESDIADIMHNQKAISSQELPDGLHIRIHTLDEAKALAAKHGGLPS